MPREMYHLAIVDELLLVHFSPTPKRPLKSYTIRRLSNLKYGIRKPYGPNDWLHVSIVAKPERLSCVIRQELRHVLSSLRFCSCYMFALTDMMTGYLLRVTSQFQIFRVEQ